MYECIYSNMIFTTFELLLNQKNNKLVFESRTITDLNHSHPCYKKNEVQLQRARNVVVDHLVGLHLVCLCPHWPPGL